ncbi:PQQ-dependent sugar dehydrogenase [soil metagenome]
MNFRWLTAVLALGVSTGRAGDPPALDWPDLQLTQVPGTAGMQRPLLVVPSRSEDGSERLYILEQAGRIRTFQDGALLGAPMLDITARVRSFANGGNEQGLLGLALPDGFPDTKDWFYVNYTANSPSGDTVVSRFYLDGSAPDPTVAGDPSSEQILITIDQSDSNHNGGHIEFGPDGYLYIGMGDGGGGNDPAEKAQNRQLLLGKMLRIDVEPPPGGIPPTTYSIPPDNPFFGDPTTRDEIWALGLRNPYRWSFDRLTGDMWIGDVGQNAFEEVNFQPADSPGGTNYGWDFYEAHQRRNDANSGTPPPANELTFPVFEYGRSLGISITGGRVYRGTTFPRMRGVYFVADYLSGRFWGLQPDGQGGFANLELLDSSLQISGFGEDPAGELMVTEFATGSLYRLTDTRDRHYLRVVTADLAPGEPVTLTLGTGIGESYQLQVSAALGTWQDVGNPIEASDTTLELTDPSPPAAPDGHLFYRAVRAQTP